MPVKHYCDFCDSHIAEGRNYYRIHLEKVAGEDAFNRYKPEPATDPVSATMVCKTCTIEIGKLIINLKTRAETTAA